MNLLAKLRKLDAARRKGKVRPERVEFEQSLSDLGPDDVAIDCGANVGSITTLLGQTGAQVYAFEPHPAAFKTLTEAVENMPNVKPIQACVTAEAGPVKLFLHKWDNEDPVYWSTGSSTVSDKRNIKADRFVTVDGIKLVDFIKELKKPVTILKVDIEGAEVDVLNQLLDEDLHEKVGKAYVEVHGDQIPALAEPTEKMIERFKAAGADHFRFDWH